MAKSKTKKEKRLFVIVGDGAGIEDGELITEEQLLESSIEEDEIIYELEIKALVEVKKAVITISELK